MTNREFYLQRQRAEFPAFMGVLRALPIDRLDYKPHERSPSAVQIVWLITSELKIGVANNRAEWKILPPLPMHEMVEKFERRSRKLMDIVSRMLWDRVVHFHSMGTSVAMIYQPSTNKAMAS